MRTLIKVPALPDRAAAHGPIAGVRLRSALRSTVGLTVLRDGTPTLNCNRPKVDIWCCNTSDG